jgi:hypothetical protein
MQKSRFPGIESIVYKNVARRRLWTTFEKLWKKECRLSWIIKKNFCSAGYRDIS